MPPQLATATPAATASPARCRLCTCQLDAAAGDDLTRGICDSCKDRPEARALGGRSGVVGLVEVGSRPFTVAEKALIKRVHGFMPAQTLLEVLNERLRADLPKARPYTMAQLHQELQALAVPESPGDWAGLRKVLAQARRAGVLAQISPQLVDDFAVVFSLTPAQVMRLKDVVLAAADEARAGDAA